MTFITAFTRKPALRLLCVAGATALVTVTASGQRPRFYSDDPIARVADTQDASGARPKSVNLIYDEASNLFGNPGDPDMNRRAMGINTIDEVPDSSWFTNRAGRVDLTAADVSRGPDVTSGPAAGSWTVTASKSDGVTPGFTVRDSAGQRWFLKVDPPGYRGMATGTEVTVTKLMWALGYNVPENHIAHMRRDQLVLADSATFTPPGGSPRRMRAVDLDRLLERAERESDGSFRVVASKALEGTPVGRIRFVGTRPDDPNDIVPHQHRRELRGYGVFAAWLNHVDAKAINSLDTLIKEDGRAYIRHHLIDFGSSLGSGGLGPAEHWEGSEYLIEPRAMVKQMLGFGFVYPQWHTSAFYESRAIGRLQEDNADFDPRAWKPRVPNQAFLHARPDDQFWAAQKLAALTIDLLSAAVNAGDVPDPTARTFLLRALVERRDAISRAYLTGVNPIADPALGPDGVLTFRNAAVDADVAHAPDSYRAVWSQFDNASGDARVIGESVGVTTALAAPVALPVRDGSYLKVELSSDGSSYPSWTDPVAAYFRYRRGTWQTVGFERMPER
jgi:hypothetical protein